METEMLLAPCGMNCSICSGILRTKPICGGCASEQPKPRSCEHCVIKRCAQDKPDGTCMTCPTMPCARLKRLDARYRSKYGMSMIGNLTFIREEGLPAWNEREFHKWQCPTCGNLLSAHKSTCLSCGETNPYYVIRKP